MSLDFGDTSEEKIEGEGGREGGRVGWCFACVVSPYFRRKSDRSLFHPHI